MNKKSSYLLIISLFVIAFSFFFVIYDKQEKIEKKKYDIEFTENQLFKKLSFYTDYIDYHNVEIKRTDAQNIIYGFVYILDANDIFGTTKGSFKYNTKNNELIYYENKYDNRIMDFYILNNTLYKIVVEMNSDGNSFNWQFIAEDINTNQETLIETGDIINAFYYPCIFVENDKIYLLSITDYDLKDGYFSKEKFAFSVLNDMKLVNLIHDEGSLINDSGNLMYNIGYSKLSNGQFYYTVIDSNYIQYLYSYNIYNGIVKEEYKNENNADLIYSHVALENGLYIQLINKEDTQKSQIIFIDNENKTNILDSNTNTFENRISKNLLLFHNMENKWVLYNTVDNILKTLRIEDLQFLPKYLVIDENEIFTLGMDSKSYTGKIINN